MAVIQKILQVGFRGSANVPALTFDANGNYLSGGVQQGVAVVPDTVDGNPLSVTLPAVGALALGIADTPPAIGPGDSVDVVSVGLMRCQAAGAITYGQILYVANASGQLGPIPADGATSVYIVGIALEAAAQAGDLITVQLLLGSQHVTV